MKDSIFSVIKRKCVNKDDEYMRSKKEEEEEETFSPNH